MEQKPFHFKQFAVADDRCTHKVGTDGVLLGSWVNILENDKLMLDIGTGSGLIALMLAQRSQGEAQIDAIEIGEEDARQAAVNVRQSPWPEKVRVWQTSLQEFSPGRQYDLIVSNPPYFVDSLMPPDTKRARARHARSLSFDDLLMAVHRLLAPHGRFAVVLPFAQGNTFAQRAICSNLHSFRWSGFMSRKHKPIERVLIEFARNQRPRERSEIVLYEQGENWSEAYKALTRDFYLKA